MAGGIIRDEAKGITPYTVNGVIVNTGVRISSDILNWWKSLTCVYDPNITEYNTDKAAIPISLFSVTKFSTTIPVESNTQRLILYEDHSNEITIKASDSSRALRKGAVQTVVDNVVVNPVTYEVEAIVPFSPIGRNIKEKVNIVKETIANLTQLIGFEDAANTFTKVNQVILTATSIVSTAATTVNKIASVDGLTYLNMNSLDVMARSGRPVCMKLWTGNQYAYGTIENLRYEKVGTEDDVFRASFQFKEKPVLSITKPTDTGKTDPSSILTKAVLAYESAAKNALVAMTGVSDAV